MSKKKLILIITGAFVVVGLLTSLMWPNANYDGDEKKAGEAAVEHAWHMLSGINYVNTPGTLKVTYENVKPDDTGNELCQNDFISSDSTVGDGFLVDVTYRTFFGISIDKATYHICEAGNQLTY